MSSIVLSTSMCYGFSSPIHYSYNQVNSREYNARRLSKSHGQAGIGTVPADRLDESRDGRNRTTSRNGLQFDDLNRRFLCALKALNATDKDDPSTTPPIYR